MIIILVAAFLLCMPNSIYQQFLEQVAGQVVATIGVTGIFTDQQNTAVHIRQFDWEDIVTLGGLTVRFDEHEIRENQEGTNIRDIWGYPAYIVHCQGADRQLTTDVTALLTLFQSIRRYYHNKRRMSGVVEGCVHEKPTVCTAGPRPPARYRDKRIRSLIVWGWFLEPRTA